MDVTALLNSSTEAAVQHDREECSRTPVRSRTPWDAGGYSLPMSTINIPSYSVGVSIASSQATPLASTSIHCDDSRFDIQRQNGTSSRHKSFSSRSSLSSTSSSLHSASHSRLSSLSTVNSCHPGQSGFANSSPSSSAEHTSQTLDLTSLDVNGEFTSAHSPKSSLGTLALVAEHHLSGDRSASLDQNPTTYHTASFNEINNIACLQDHTPPRRPCSPSDAILIKRSKAPLIHSNTDLNIDHDQL